MTTVDEVYSQRNALAVALAKVVLLNGGRAGRGIDVAFDDGWCHVVYVDVPGAGQVSWHMGPNEVALLDGLPQYPGEWDGTYTGRDTTWPNLIPLTKPDVEPVAAQHRFRHPQKGTPDWSVWQPCKVAQRPAWEIDSQGYEVEYRALYAAPQPAKQPLSQYAIDRIVGSLQVQWPDYFDLEAATKLTRAIEAAHGITGAQK